jgi:hypothetical protein
LDHETPADLIARIDALVSPIALDDAVATHRLRLELFRRREHPADAAERTRSPQSG